MSDVNSESKPATRKEVLLLIGIAFLTMIGVAWGVFVGMGRPIDGDAALRERFGANPWPLDLEVTDAHKLSAGDRMVRLARKADSELGDDVPDAVIVHFVRDAGTAALMFPPPSKVEGKQADKVEAWEQDPAQVYRHEIVRGRVEFDDQTGLYIRERLYRDTGDWVDSMRVNFSNAEPPCVVFAEFPAGVNGNEEGFARLLEGLEVKAQP